MAVDHVTMPDTVTARDEAACTASALEDGNRWPGGSKLTRMLWTGSLYNYAVTTRFGGPTPSFMHHPAVRNLSCPRTMWLAPAYSF